MDNKSNERNVFNSDGFTSFEAADGPLSLTPPTLTKSVSEYGDGEHSDCDVCENSDTGAAVTDTDAVVDNEKEPMDHGATSFASDTFKSYGEGEEGGVSADSPNGKKGAYEYKPGHIVNTGGRQTKNSGVSFFLFSLTFPALIAAFIAMFVKLFTGGGTSVIIFALVLAVINTVIGSVQRKRGNGGTKNLILGIIALALTLMMLLVSSANTSIFGSSFWDDDEFPDQELLSYAENFIKTDIDGYYDYYVMNNGYTLLYEEDFDEIEEALLANRSFVSSYPTAMIGMLPPEERSEYFDYCVFINMTTNEINTLPDTAGSYHIVCITVTSFAYGDDYEISIYSYNIDYKTHLDSAI